MAKLADVKTAAGLDITKLVQRAVDVAGQHVWWMLYGPSGHGKTTAIASAAANYPAKLPAPELVSLEGVAIVQFDRGGVDSLKAVNLDCPVIDLSACTTVGQIRAGVAILPEVVKQYNIHTLAIDTWSALDKAVLADLQHRYTDGKFGLYQAILGEHNETLKVLRGLPCNVIFSCHSKSKVVFKEGDFAAQMENKALATETPGNFDISIDLAGQTKDFLRAQCSGVFPMIAEKLGKQEPDYAIYPYGYPGFEYKCRYRCFQPKEKPNLYRMMQLVKGNLA